jgi:hypothetical protein
VRCGADPHVCGKPSAAWHDRHRGAHDDTRIPAHQLHSMHAHMHARRCAVHDACARTHRCKGFRAARHSSRRQQQEEVACARRPSYGKRSCRCVCWRVFRCVLHVQAGVRACRMRARHTPQSLTGTHPGGWPPSAPNSLHHARSTR